MVVEWLMCCYNSGLLVTDLLRFGGLGAVFGYAVWTVGLGVVFVGLGGCLLGVWLIWCFGLTCFRRLFAVRWFGVGLVLGCGLGCDFVCGFWDLLRVYRCVLDCLVCLVVYVGFSCGLGWVGCLLGFAGVWVLWCVRCDCSCLGFVWCSTGFGFGHGLGFVACCGFGLCWFVLGRVWRFSVFRRWLYLG